MDLRWPKIVALLFAASFILIVAVRLNIEQMHLMAGTLVSVPIVAVAAGWLSLRRISAQRSAPATCTEGTPFAVTLTTGNTDWSSRAVLSLRDSVPEWIEVQGTSEQASGGLSVTYRAVPRRRGLHLLGPARIEASDPLGISTFHRHCGGQHELVVYPTPYLPPEAVPLVSAVLAGAVLARPKFRGDSTDFDSTREYRDGDEPRWIHWPSTARRGHLVVVERSREVDDALLVAVDLRHGTEAGRPPNSTLDASARLAAYVSREALQHGVKVGLLAVAAEDLSVPPGRTEAQHIAILESLARMTASCPSPFADVLQRWLSDIRSPSLSALLFLTSDPDPAVLEVLTPLADRGTVCCGLLLDDWDSAGQTDRRSPSSKAAAFLRDASAVGIQAAVLKPFAYQP